MHITGKNNNKLTLILLLNFIAGIPTAIAANCEAVGKLIAFSGTVQYQASASTKWIVISNNLTLCSGSAIKTLSKAKASIRLNNGTLIKLKSSSVLKLPHTRQNKFVDLLTGIGHFISRAKSKFEVKSPLINTFIEGTEFLVSSSKTQGKVTVLKGKIKAYNQYGSLRLKAGQIAIARQGQTPALSLNLTAEDELNWSINYPIELLNLDQANIRQAINYLNTGNSRAAKSLLKKNKNPESTALLALIMLSENKRSAALKLINSVSAKTENLVLVKSYIHQSLHNLDAAETVLD